MKKIITVLCFLTFNGFMSQSQTIKMLSENRINKPGENTIDYNFIYTIAARDIDAKYEATVSDLAEGTAAPDIDYIHIDIQKVAATDFLEPVSFKISLLKTDLCRYADRTIILHISVKPDKIDTIYKQTFVLIIHRSDKLTDQNIKDCRQNSSSSGVWNENRDQNQYFDPSNTVKTEFVNYTDFKGFDQDQPNGTAQSQFLFKIPINRYSRHWKDGETQHQWFRSAIIPNFLFNRIDKTNDPVTLQRTKYVNRSGDTSYDKVINSFDFIRYSNFVLNTKLTVLTIIRPKSRYQLQLNGNLFKIKVDSAAVTTTPTRDNSVGTSDTVALNPVYASGFGAELYYDTKFSENEFPFNFRFTLGGQVIRLRSSEYTQANIATITPDNKTQSPVLEDNSNKISKPIWSFSAMIKKNLDLGDKSSTEGHYLFFRFNYSWQQFKGLVIDPANEKSYISKTLNNNFAQFQLGIDLNFDSFFSNK